MATPTDATHIYNNRRYLYTTTRTWCDSILHFTSLPRLLILSSKYKRDSKDVTHLPDFGLYDDSKNKTK
jgi:hypothetical protein